MKSWEEGKRELQKEIARIFSHIDKNLTAEISDSSTVRVGREELRILRENSAQIGKLVESNARLADELEKCRAVATRVDSLEKENKNLAAELQLYLHSVKARNQNEPQSNAPNVQISTKSVTSSSEMIDLAEHQRLVKKYSVISENCLQLKEAWVKMEGKLREYKKRGRNWNLCLEEKDANIKKKKQRIKKLEQQIIDLNIRLSDENRLRIYSSTELLQKSPPEYRTEILQDISGQGEKKDGEFSSRLVHFSCLEDPFSQKLSKSSSPDCEMSSNASFRDIPYPLTPSYKSNMTNEKENPTNEELIGYAAETDLNTTSQGKCIASDVTIKEESMMGIAALHDTPTVIQNPKISVKRKKLHENEGMTKTAKNEMEEKDTIKKNLQYFKESMDLDDIGYKADTPRKAYSHIQMTKQLNSSGYSSGPIILQGSQNEMYPMKNTVNSKISNNSNSSSCQNKSEVTRNISQQKISPNTTEKSCAKRRCSTRTHYQRSLSWSPKSGLAQDGEKSNPNTLKCSDATGHYLDPPLLSGFMKSPVISSGSEDRLKNYSRIWDIPNVSENEAKNSPRSLSNKTETLIPTEQKTLATSSLIRFPRPYDKYKDKPISSKNKLNSDPSSSIKQPTSPIYTNSRSASTSKSIIRSGKLRTRPIEKLNVQDFKINPDYNQGYHFAFSEVVRGHARNGLQGCLKPCCEPKYRALAEVSLNQKGSPTASQEKTNQSILEEFLGDNAYKLANMSPEERKELLIQAKTRDLANKHGLHRHAYEAPETPVGIWRANFPTTQELIDEKKIIIERKRKAVEKRYAEAMRPGGAYKFRDE